MQVLSMGQKASFEYCGTNYLLSVSETLVEGQGEGGVKRGKLGRLTQFAFETPPNSGIKVTNSPGGEVPWTPSC